VLNSIDRFAEVAFTPVLLNVAMIGCVLGLTPVAARCGLRRLDRRRARGPLQWLWLLCRARATASA
jgi:putative peptidoglycan lipid II flippase